MNVNFEYYRIFYYVAKYRNFTKAARVLGNSQPNITRAMNCLEQQVHATLFIRTNRGVQLTSEGEELYNYVSAAMAQIFAAEEALSENDGCCLRRRKRYTFSSYWKSVCLSVRSCRFLLE